MSTLQELIPFNLINGIIQQSCFQKIIAILHYVEL